MKNTEPHFFSSFEVTLNIHHFIKKIEIIVAFCQVFCNFALANL